LSRTWIKLYTEILGDVKVGTLTDRQYRIMITCFLMAGQKDKSGHIGITEEIAWAVVRGKSIETIKSDLKALTAARIISKTDSGWHLTNWEKRQSRPPSRQADMEAARKRAWRKKSASCPQRTASGHPSDAQPVRTPEAEAEAEAEVEGKISPSPIGKSVAEKLRGMYGRKH
jgi:hypothetical protein